MEYARCLIFRAGHREEAESTAISGSHRVDGVPSRSEEARSEQEAGIHQPELDCTSMVARYFSDHATQVRHAGRNLQLALEQYIYETMLSLCKIFISQKEVPYLAQIETFQLVCSPRVLPRDPTSRPSNGSARVCGAYPSNSMQWQVDMHRWGILVTRWQGEKML